DDGRRQPGVRDQSIFNSVTDIDARRQDNTCGKSRIESMTCDAPRKSSAAVKELRMMTHFSPAARAAASPRAESSITSASSGCALNFFTALKYGSGSGFALAQSSTVRTNSKKSRILRER